MKKNILSLLLLAGMFSAANAQTYKGRVGVNTTTPASTMDIVGVPADATVTDGLIAPRLTGDELKAKDALYTSAQTGALVYATAAVGTSSTKTANVTLLMLLLLLLLLYTLLQILLQGVISA